MTGDNDSTALVLRRRTVGAVVPLRGRQHAVVRGPGRRRGRGRDFRGAEAAAGALRPDRSRPRLDQGQPRQAGRRLMAPASLHQHHSTQHQHQQRHRIQSCRRFKRIRETLKRLTSTSAGRCWLVWVSGGRKWMLGSSKITNVACLGVFDLGTDSALSRQPECAKTFHMGLYDPPPLKWSRRTIFDRNVFFRIATVHPPTPAIAAL
jgi:hypothetical protein